MNKKNKRTAHRTLSLLLALVLLLGTLPQITLPVHAGDIRDYEIDGHEYRVQWGDEPGEGTVCIECEYCTAASWNEISDGDHESMVYTLIDHLFPYDCDHCIYCAEDYHCHGCQKCFDTGDAEECPYCNTMLCLDCHDDDCFCDLCGNCRLNSSAAGTTSSGHIVNMPNLRVVCEDCYEQQEECAACPNVIAIADYKTYDEAGMDWCEECRLCNECFEDTSISSKYGHCIECGVCGFDEDVCEDCKRCDSCSEDTTHCSMCGLCYGEEGVEWCADGGLHCVLCCMEHNWICYQCDECMFATSKSRCDDCDLCEECCAENTEDAGCIHGYCVYSSDYDEHVCPMCGLCPEDMECEFCGMCENCQDEYHCQHGICPEDDTEWEEHLCESCGECYELDELCEFCHMCENCWEHCDHGICPEDSSYDDHICSQCGDCYDESEFCDDCGLCENCCEENAQALGCDHGLCIESYEFQSHYCFTDGQCRMYCNHDPACTHRNVSTSWEKNESSHWHECEDCGAAVDSEAHAAGEPVIIEQPNPLTGKNGKARVSCTVCGQYMQTVTVPCIEIPKDGSPYILSEPKDYKGKVSDVIENYIPRYATYRVTAGGEGLKYQWYRRVNGVNPTKLEDMTGDEYWYNISGMEEIHGATTNELTVFVFGTSCYDLYEYWCVVTNKYGSVTTRYAKQDAQHVFGYYCNNGDGTHSNCCFGDGCGEVKGRPAAHRYTEWELKQAATATQQGVKQQTCLDCGHVQKSYIPVVEPGHVHSFTKQKRSMTKHWYECACGERRNEQPHTLGEWETVKLPTVEFEGQRVRKCSGCSYKQTETIDKLSHVHDFESLKRRDPKRIEFDQYFELPNGYITEDAHVRYCAKCSAIQEEEHRYGYWSLIQYPYTDKNGHRHYGMVGRRCRVCGHADTRYFTKGKWPVMTEVYDSETGFATGGPASISGTAMADAGETVTVKAAAFSGYLLNDAGQGYGTWSFSEVNGHEGTEIGGTWHAFKNSEIKDIKLNSDGSVTFTMPDGPVGLMVFPKKCDHKGYGTTPGTIPATCTGYGSKVERCEKCRGVVTTTDILDPIGHDWETIRVDEYGDCDYREVVYQECSRCYAERYRKTEFVHEWEDVNEGTEPSCYKAGREPDQECKYCGAQRRGDFIPAYGSHSFGAWKTIKAPTTRTKGQQTRTCTRCGFEQTQSMDYSGPDYRIRPDKTRIHFDFTYGEQPEPQTVTFTSIGRSDVHSVTRVEEGAIGYVTTWELNGMTMTVYAVPWEMIQNMTDQTEELHVWEVDGMELPDDEKLTVEVSANIRKTAEKYDLTVEGGKAWIQGKDRRTAKASLSVSGGEYINLVPDDSENFVRWEVEDASGYIQSFWERRVEYQEPEAYFAMSANAVKLKALTKNTPNVYEIRFDPNASDVSYMNCSKFYTNSSGELDLLPVCYRRQYTIDGWWTKPSGGVRADVGMAFTGDTTLYAHWRANTEVQSDPFPLLRFTKDSRAAVDGSLIVDIENMAEENDALMEAYFGGDYVTQWFRNGRLISGYNYDSLQLSEADRGSQIHAVICFNGHQIVGEDVRILGRDELPPASYTVSFDAGPGHVSPSSALTGPDGKLKTLPEPWRENYAFAGWYTRGLDYEKIFVDVDTVYSKDTTLYAEWEEEEQYDLEIAGTRVTSTNRNDILGDGLFSFDGDKTLTVRGSCTARRHVIYNKGVEGLIINVAGDATFMSANDWEPIKLEADTTITGTGTLTVTTGVTGIYMYSRTGTLTIRDANVEVANQWGIAGPNGDNSTKLILENANVKAGCVTAAICDFGGGITMKNCQILLPRDGKISDDGTDIVDAEGNDAYTLIIEATGPVTPPPPPDDFRFDDVRDESKFYFHPVYWAYNADPQITNGIDKTHFGPDRGCTRGQVVTFLWRAAGCPEPAGTETAFTDVKPGAFYEKAVAWAVENKITNGMSPTSFAPDATCTRGQIVTFLWRFRNTPEPGGAGNPFADVTDGAYYYKAVLWAVENKITNGMSPTSFAPNSTCTRGQIVTFLYRTVGGE